MTKNKSIIDTSAQNALKNSAYNFIGFLLPIIILIFFTPIIISKLGVKEYGIYIFLNTILTFLVLLDLGIGIATNKHIVEYVSTNQIERLKKLLYSMNSVYLILAFVYLFVCVGIGIIMQTFFVNLETPQNYLLLLSIIGMTGFMNSIFSNFVNSITALQRYDLYLKINGSFLLLSNTCILFLAINGYKLISIVLSQLVVTFLSMFVYYTFARKIFPQLSFKYSWDRDEIASNYRYALPIAFNNIASSSLVHFDKLLIPVFLGAAPLTYYSVPGSIAARITSLSGTFSSLLFPITVNLHALEDTEKIRRIFIRSVRLITVLSSSIALSIILLADKILLFWLGEDFTKQSVTVLIVLALTNLILAVFSPLSNLLTALNKMKFLTIGSIIMAIINIVSLLILVPLYGINGAAYAYLISVLWIFWMFHFATKKYFQIKHRIHFQLILKVLLTIIPFYIIVHYVLKDLITNMFTLALVGPLCIMLFMVLYKSLGFMEQEDWEDLKLFIRKIRNKV
jgi:O-antigen/teichoic acid export membrane protein